MAFENPFLVFPREIRDKIYNYTIQDIKFTNILAHKTAYTPQNAPILYINDAIANDVKHLLYKDHEMVAHIGQPRLYAEGPTGYLSHVQRCSRLMKQRSHTFVAELWRSQYSRFNPSFQGCNESEEEFGRHVITEYCIPAIAGDDHGELLSRKFFGELADVQPELPNLQRVEINSSIVIWLGFCRPWKQPLDQYNESRMGHHTDVYCGEA
ncbi:hypothetical protein FPOAC2_00175 [Fusarium poae]|jgi:hypothetical protein|uniref:Uncharacterized protein n=1 Tax=Fusarium poae TaxID=36050 RepID=A0A1B8B0F0_FUSPO|nr:hypothetical protein FPOAC1_000153 [Fusarium poae]KAG8674190.1 hypothetical protein FPOAC1_000153 [Fusarium poae]OBS26203.1 hypothetical protein FPOA_00144 [Fusarium poae]